MTWKGELYFVDEPTADPGKLEGSLVAFTKNGLMQGVAYRLSPLLQGFIVQILNRSFDWVVHSGHIRLMLWKHLVWNWHDENACPLFKWQISGI